MDRHQRIAEARQIMLEFAEQTGLSTTANPPRRYLWTDAHAVCNFLSLYRQTDDDEFKGIAVALIDQVHNVLGKHRDDDVRRGWISGLSEEEGRRHPTAGGLRIGKELNERGPHDPFDERLEWDRDGQYFHYLTKWMHALCRAAAVTGESRYCRWASELAKAAHAGFAVARLRDGGKGIFWKMSIDLTRPQVPSTGLHDPLDGYITYNEIEHCESWFPNDSELPHLESEIAEAAAMIQGRHWETSDPLGIGGLLFDAGRVSQLASEGRLENSALLEELIRDSGRSLGAFAGHLPLSYPPEHRLAFRELGLSIGLQTIPLMRTLVETNPDMFTTRLKEEIDDLNKYLPLSGAIEDFWRKPSSQQANTWREHLDINAVTLATSLLPDEFLNLHPQV
jgi:hypothetical protein